MTEARNAIFAYRLAVDRIGDRAQQVKLEAGEAARAALAARFGLEAIERLEADLTVVRRGTAIAVTGPVTADVVQQCVVSAEPVPAHVAETIDLLFETDPSRVPADDEEVTAETVDILPVEGGAIDLGEAVAQTVVLALDPYPRADEATLAAARRFLLREDEAEEGDAAARAEAKGEKNPFAKLRPQ